MDRSLKYLQPTLLEDALEILDNNKVSILAGGTDFFPSRGDCVGHIDILDLTRIDALNGIEETPDHFRIGSNVTWTNLIETPLPHYFDGLKLAAREVGSVQIQNTGTIVGNLCNGSPAADGVPPLLTLMAEVEISSRRGKRFARLEEFILGIRTIDLSQSEIVTAINIPKRSKDTRSSFLKLGSRKYLVISIAMIAVLIHIKNEQVIDVKVAVGACSKVGLRLTKLEQCLKGKMISKFINEDFVHPSHLECLNPIDDIRGSANYRMDVVAELCQRAVISALEAF